MKSTPPPPPAIPRGDGPACPALQPVTEVHRNPWFAVCNRGGYFTVEYNERQVMVLPLVDRQHIVMVRALRPVLGGTLLELPAGGCGAAEEPVAAAARELGEETGISIADLARFQPLPTLSALPRMPHAPLNFLVHLTAQEFSRRGPSDHEIAEVVCFSLAEFAARVANAEICVSQGIAVACQYLLASGALQLAGRP